MKKHFLIVIIFLFFSIPADCTHIIGGYMSYRHVTGQQYEIELIVYRDCYSGIPPFDDPAYVAMYDNAGNHTLTLTLNINYSGPVISSNQCTVSNLCIERASYITNITIPVAGGPQTFVYQRCCRSLAIANLVDPGNMGISVTCTINPSIINDSPVYDHEYAAFSYSGDIFRFYASADDADGDSLVYSLDDLVEGASQNDPLPMIPSPPPYLNIPWNTGYSQSNMFNGPVPLSINNGSGLLYGIPGQAGYFAIACKTDEYRNGILIGSYRREFVVVVDIPTIIDIPGTVQVQGGGTPLDEGNAWLIKFNGLDSTLFAVDTTDVTGGSFLHNDRINGLYLSKVSALTTSNYYTDHIPTYFGDVIFWNQATVLVYCDSVGVNPDINMVQGVNPGGPGFIGGFIADGANKYSFASLFTGAADDVTVILFNSLNEPVGFDVTDASGYFGIGNLPPGDYSIQIDRLGYLVDNTLAPIVSVNSQQPIIDNQQFLLHNTWLEHQGTVGTNEQMELFAHFYIYPNPSDSYLYLKVTGQIQSRINFCIYNTSGAMVYSGVTDNNLIDIRHLLPQFYLLKVYDGEKELTSKFLKNE